MQSSFVRRPIILAQHISSPAPTRATANNYHPTVVLYIRRDVRLHYLVLTVFPIPAYTGERLCGIDSEGWVAQLPVGEEAAYLDALCRW